MSDAKPHRDEHGARVSGMFGRIAKWYDFLNHFLSFGQDIYWRHRLVRHVRLFQTHQVLDLAAGTMDVSLEILRQHSAKKVISVDFALPMLKKGVRKAPDLKGGRIMPVCGDGKKLPLPDSCVDAATIAFGIRNILPRSEAYREIQRVLVPGGRLCILEFGSGRGKIWKGLYNLYLNRILPLMGRVVSGDAGAYSYLARTIREFPDARELGRELVAAGFERVAFHPLCSGIVYIHLAEKGAA